jgi:hypothetical protein
MDMRSWLTNTSPPPPLERGITILQHVNISSDLNITEATHRHNHLIAEAA